jgi:multicomponent Na+:H+ antiporter subunit D
VLFPAAGAEHGRDPPSSCFAAKFGLFDATARDREWTSLAVAVPISLLTLFSIFKIWIAVFWRPRDVAIEAAAGPPARAPLLMLAPTAARRPHPADRRRRRAVVPLQPARRRRPRRPRALP